MSLTLALILICIAAVIGYYIGNELGSGEADANEAIKSLVDTNAKNMERRLIVTQIVADIVFERLRNRMVDWYPGEECSVQILTEVGHPTKIYVQAGERSTIIPDIDTLEQITFGQNEKETLDELFKIDNNKDKE